MRKFVGITCSTIHAEKVDKHALNRAYVWAVEQAGGIPIVFPVTRDEEILSRYLSRADGLLIPGGVDVAPARYGHAPHPRLGEVDADRDATEIPLILQAVAQDMPMFAICRGIQVVNIALGGTLWQDLPSEQPSDIRHQQTDYGIPRSAFGHSIAIEPESRYAEIVGATEMEVNSMHHQAIRDLAEGLTVTARAPDGVIEAVESRTHRFLVAAQFHPEETAPHDEKSRRLFQAFVKSL